MARIITNNSLSLEEQKDKPVVLSPPKEMSHSAVGNKKRANGTGSVTQLENGQWRAKIITKVYTVIDDNGKNAHGKARRAVYTPRNMLPNLELKSFGWNMKEIEMAD